MTRLLPAGFVRPGSSLLETMVSMILFGAVLASVAGALRQHNALAGSQRDRSARGMAVRTTYTILDRELHWLRPPVDVAFDGSVVSIRALRGVGVVCTGRGAELLVRVTGYRAPNPEKDSVIVLGTDHETVRALRRVGPGRGCPTETGERLYSLRLDEPAVGQVILYFERGEYHLADAALRYRRGAEGRQPLTAQVLDGARLGRAGPLRAGVATGVRVRVPATPDEESGGAAFRIAFRNMGPDSTGGFHP